jgi:hypothetical protein
VFVAYYQFHDDDADSDTVKFGIFTDRARALEQLAVWEEYFRQPERRQYARGHWGSVWKIAVDVIDNPADTEIELGE